MRDSNAFQAILIGVFAILLVVGVAAVALYRATGGGSAQIGPVKIWGTLPVNEVNVAVGTLQSNDPSFSQILYEEQDPRTYEEDLIEALATGNGPDLFFIPQDWILRHQNKIFIVPYTSLAENIFRDTFIEAGEIFLHPKGILAIPFAIDPMVMYWNRDIVTTAGFTQPPRYWDEMFNFSEKVTKRTQDLRVMQSAIAFGESVNVVHTKEILSSLLLQVGNTITVRTPDDGVKATLSQDANTVSVLRFYTEFSNPLKTVYSWNRSLPSSRDAFLRGELALYFGFASERESLLRENPNLNFAVAAFPQVRDAARPTTFANMTGIAVSKSSKNISGAFLAAWGLAGGAPIKEVAAVSDLPPVRRDILSQRPTNAYEPVFYDAALIARTWLDPNGEETEKLFNDMIDTITSGKSSVPEAIAVVNSALSRIK